MAEEDGKIFRYIDCSAPPQYLSFQMKLDPMTMYQLNHAIPTYMYDIFSTKMIVRDTFENIKYNRESPLVTL